MKRTVIIDGNAYAHRAFHVAIKRNKLDTLEKTVQTMFLNLIGATFEELKPTHVAVAFDSMTSFRDAIYPDYKANRKAKKSDKTIVTIDGVEVEINETAGGFIKRIRKVTEMAGLKTFKHKLLEGDDIMATIARGVDEGLVYICARDKDMGQEVTDRVFQYWPMEKKIIKTKDVEKAFKVKPSQVRDYLCLLGDQVDNIPGVPNIGPVTAAKWLNQYGSIAEVLKDPRMKAKLQPHMKNLVLAKKLTTLRIANDLIKFSMEDLVPRKPEPELAHHIWKTPQSILNLASARKAAQFKGLFG